MAEQRVQYIIDLIASDEKLRRQMSKWNWEKILGTDGEDLGDIIAGGSRERIEKILNGVHIDWSQVLNKTQIEQLEKSLARSLANSRRDLENLANAGDASGIQNVIDAVITLGNGFASLGSSFDAQSLAKGMTAFMKVLMPITSKIEELADKPKLVEAAYDRLFKKGVVGANNMSAASDKVLNVVAKIETATKRTGGAQATLDSLIQKFSQLKNMELPDLSHLTFSQLEEEMEKIDDEWDKLNQKFAGKKRSNEYLLQKGQLLMREMNVTRAYALHGEDVDVVNEDIKDIEAQINRVFATIEEKIDKLKEQLNSDTFAQAISKQLTDLKINLSLDEKAKTEFTRKLDQFISELSNKDISSVKVNVDWMFNASETLKNNSRIIPDIDNIKQAVKDEIDELNKELEAKEKEKIEYQQQINDGQRTGKPKNTTAEGNLRKTKERIAELKKLIRTNQYFLDTSDDPATKQALTSTLNSFRAIQYAVKHKQDAILSQTDTWRQKMIEAMSINKKEANIQIGFDKGLEASADAVYNYLQQYFQENQIELHINKEELAKELQEVVGSGGVSIGGGGTVNLDAQSLKTAIAEGLIAALTGDVGAFGETKETTPSSKIEQQKMVYLDPNSPYMKHMAEEVRSFAEYAKKDTVPAKKIREFFDRKVIGYDENGKAQGIKIDEYENASSMEISDMLSLLVERHGVTLLDEFDDLIKNVGKNSVLQHFRGDLSELLYSQNINSITVDEYQKRRDSIEIFKSVVEKSQMLEAFNINNPKWQIQGIEDFDKIFSIASKEALSTLESIDPNDGIHKKEAQEYYDNIVQKYESLRTVIANKDGLDATAQKERLEAAIIEFRDSIRETYNRLYNYVNAHDMDVFVDGVNKPYHVSGRGSALRANAALGGDDSKIKDVRVYSDISTGALGVTGKRQELKLMRAYGSKSNVIRERPDRTDILNRETKFNDFVPSDNSSKTVDGTAADDAEKRAKRAEELVRNSEAKAAKIAQTETEIEKQIEEKRKQKESLENQISTNKETIAKENDNPKKLAGTRRRLTNRKTKLDEAKAELDAAKVNKEILDNTDMSERESELSDIGAKRAKYDRWKKNLNAFIADPDKYEEDYSAIAEALYGQARRDARASVRNATENIEDTQWKIAEQDKNIRRIQSNINKFGATEERQKALERANIQRELYINQLREYEQELDEQSPKIREIEAKILGTTDADKEAFREDFQKYITKETQKLDERELALGKDPRVEAEDRVTKANKAYKKAEREYGKVAESDEGKKAIEIDQLIAKNNELENRVSTLSEELKNAEAEKTRIIQEGQSETTESKLDLAPKHDEIEKLIGQTEQLDKDIYEAKQEADAIDKKVKETVGAKDYKKPKYDVKYTKANQEKFDKYYSSLYRESVLTDIANDEFDFSERELPKNLTANMKKIIDSLKNSREVFRLLSQDFRTEYYTDEDLTREIKERLSKSASGENKLSPIVEEFYNRILNQGREKANKWLEATKKASEKNIKTQVGNLKALAQNDSNIAKNLEPDLKSADTSLKNMFQKRTSQWLKDIQEKMALLNRDDVSQEEKDVARYEIDELLQLVQKANSQYTSHYNDELKMVAVSQRAINSSASRIAELEKSKAEVHEKVDLEEEKKIQEQIKSAKTRLKEYEKKRQEIIAEAAEERKAPELSFVDSSIETIKKEIEDLYAKSNLKKEQDIQKQIADERKKIKSNKKKRKSAVNKAQVWSDGLLDSNLEELKTAKEDAYKKGNFEEAKKIHQQIQEAYKNINAYKKWLNSILEELEVAKADAYKNGNVGEAQKIDKQIQEINKKLNIRNGALKFSTKEDVLSLSSLKSELEKLEEEKKNIQKDGNKRKEKKIDAQIEDVKEKIKLLEAMQHLEKTILDLRRDYSYRSYLSKEENEYRSKREPIRSEIDAKIAQREPILQTLQAELLKGIKNAKSQGEIDVLEDELKEVNEELATYAQYRQQVANDNLLSIFQYDTEFVEKYKNHLLEIIKLEQQADLERAKGATEIKLSSLYDEIDNKKNEFAAPIYDQLQEKQTNLLREIDTFTKEGKDVKYLVGELELVNQELVEYELNARRIKDTRIGEIAYKADSHVMQVYNEQTREAIKLEQKLALARAKNEGVEDALSAQRSQRNNRTRAINKAQESRMLHEEENSPRVQALKYLRETDKAYREALQKRSTVKRRIRIKEAQIDDIENDSKYSTSWQYKRHQRVVKDRLVGEYVGSDQYYKDKATGQANVETAMREYLKELLPPDAIEKVLYQLKLTTDKRGEKIDPSLLAETYKDILADNADYKKYVKDRETEYQRILDAPTGTIDTGVTDLNLAISEMHKSRDALEEGRHRIEQERQANIDFINSIEEDKYAPLKQEMRNIASRIDFDSMVGGFQDIVSKKMSREATINNIKNQVLKAGGNQTEANALAQQLDTIGDNALKDVRTWSERFLPKVFLTTEDEFRDQARKNLIANENEYADREIRSLQYAYARSSNNFKSIFNRETNKGADVYLNKYLGAWADSLLSNSEFQDSAGAQFKDILDKFKSLMEENVYGLVSNYAKGLVVENGMLGGINIREEVRQMLLAELDILLGNRPDINPVIANIDTDIARIEKQRKDAMEFGGISSNEIADADVLKEQAMIATRLTEEKEKQAELTEQIAYWEKIEGSDEELGRLNRALDETNIAISRLQMLHDNRDVLLELQREARADEKAAQQWTPDKQRLWLTNKIEVAKANMENEDPNVRKHAEEQLARYTEMLNRLEAKIAAEDAERRKDSSIIGMLTKALKDAFGGKGGFALDATGIASEATLTQILQILTGLIEALGGQVIRDPEMEKKLAEIRAIDAELATLTNSNANTSDADNKTNEQSARSKKNPNAEEIKKDDPDYILAARNFNKNELSNITTQEGLATIAQQLVKDIERVKKDTKEAITLQLKLQKVINKSGDLYKKSSGNKSYKPEDIGKILGIGDKIDLRISEKKARKVEEKGFAESAEQVPQSNHNADELLFVSNTSNAFKALYDAILLCKRGFDGLNGALINGVAPMSDAPQADKTTDAAQALLQQAQALGKFVMPLQDTQGMSFNEFLAEAHKYFELTNNRQMTPREMTFGVSKDDGTGHRFISNEQGVLFGSFGQGNNISLDSTKSSHFHSHPDSDSLFSIADLKIGKDTESFGLLLPDYSYLTVSGLDKLNLTDDDSINKLYKIFNPDGQAAMTASFGDAFVSAMEFPEIQKQLADLGVTVQRYSFDENGNVFDFNHSVSEEVVNAYNEMKQFAISRKRLKRGTPEREAFLRADATIRNSADYARLSKNNSSVWAQYVSDEAIPGHTFFDFDKFSAMQELSDRGLDLTRMFDDLRALVDTMPDTDATKVLKSFFAQVDNGAVSTSLLNTPEMRNVVKHILGESQNIYGDDRSKDVLESYGYKRDPWNHSRLIDVSKGDINSLTESAGYNSPSTMKAVYIFLNHIVDQYVAAMTEFANENNDSAIKAFKEKYHDLLQVLFPNSKDVYQTLENINLGNISRDKTATRIAGLYGIETKPEIEQGAVAKEVEKNEAETPAAVTLTPVLDSNRKEIVAGTSVNELKQGQKDAYAKYIGRSVGSYSPSDDIFSSKATVQAKVEELKGVMSTSAKDSEEYLKAMVEMSRLISTWRNVVKKTKPEMKDNAEWQKYLTKGKGKLFDKKEDVPIGSISSRSKVTLKQTAMNLGTKISEDAKNELFVSKESAENATKEADAKERIEKAEEKGKKNKSKKNDAQEAQSAQQKAEAKKQEVVAEEKITEEKKEQQVIDNTRVSELQERRSELIKETDGYAPKVVFGEGGSLGGLALDSTLQDILTAIRNIQSNGIKKGGSGSGAGTSRNKNKTEADLIRERALSQDAVVRGLAAGRGEEKGGASALYAKYEAEVEALNKAVDNANKQKKNKKAVDINAVKTAAAKVSALTKNILKDTAEWDYITSQSDDVWDYELPKNQKMTKERMEEEAKKTFDGNKEQYKFLSFDGNKLTYQLTDLEGKVRNVTLVWSDFNQQMAITSDKSVGKLDTLAGKVDKLKTKFEDAKDVGYLNKDDADLKAFTDKLTAIDNAIANGDTFENIEKLRNEAIQLGDIVNKRINKNKGWMVGTGAKTKVENQYNKIFGTIQASDVGFADDSLLYQKYIDAYNELIEKYNTYAKTHNINDPKIQQQLQQEATKVEILGKNYLASVTEAERLSELAEQSGTYKNRRTGEEVKLGGTTDVTAKEVTNLKAKMLDYVKNGLGQANIEGVKFDDVNKRLIYTFRTSKTTVADMVVQYNDATNALYAYRKQEHESLTGLPAFMNSMKSKMRSILQYTASITSIYRVFNELKRGIQYIKEIDSALTELKKVTDETEKTYDKFLKTAAKTADKVGSTIKEVVSSTADWSRIGYSLEEAATLAESTAILLNVSEFQSIEDATSALTSTLQAFGYTANESMHVVDILNEVGNNFAISSDGIATALQDSASSLMAANNSYEQAVALIASANRVVILRHGL